MMNSSQVSLQERSSKIYYFSLGGGVVVQKFTLDFCFKGNRNYINGTDIYCHISNLISKLYQEIDLKELNMSIQKFSNKNNDITVSDPEENLVYPDGFTARFSINSSRGKISGFLTETNKEVSCRCAYNEDNIYKQCIVDNHHVNFNGETVYSTIEVVVAMTKYLHMQIFKDECKGKWIFSKLEVNRLFNETDKENLSIELIKNIGYKLTKSQIISNDQVLGYIYFSLVGE